MKEDKFHLQHFLRGEEQYHLAKVNIRSKQDISIHGHDYAELFWVIHGSGVHVVNQEEIKISSGHMIMIRPTDKHAFYSKAKSGLSLLNVAFSMDTLTLFRKRYFPTTHLYFWTLAKLPFQLILPMEVIHRLNQRAEEAMRQKRTLLQLDSLLLFVFRQLAVETVTEESKQLPIWFYRAMQSYNSPFYFQQGLQGFVLLCRRNVDYINKVSRQCFNRSLTAVLNDYKLQYAATQLTMTNMPIKEIAQNCGYQNLSYFYRLFRRIYHQTPNEYRRSMQLVV